MHKREFVPAEGVSNIELFYDLIFVYCISVLTSLCHHVEGDFLDWGTWGIYMFSFFVVLQIWFFTTFLMNRYGDRSASDNVCLFVNMFLLYFLAGGIRTDWENSGFTFNMAWALILINLIVHWALKRFRYSNLDADDKRIMTSTVVVLALQLAIVVTAITLPTVPGEIASWVALVFGSGVFTQARVYRRKPSRFGHLAERCSLLVIIAFGETIVAIAAYMTQVSSIVFPILVFALVVGLFLIYIYEHDNMIDHHKDTDGMAYLTLTGWVILVIGNLTVALEYMPMTEIAFIPKSAYLTGGLVLYLLTSFLLGRYNKPAFRYSKYYVIGRLITCAFIVAVAVATDFNPLINLVCDTLAVFFALWHEWLLYHGRMKMVAFGHSLGMTNEDMMEAAKKMNSSAGKRTVMQAVRAAYARQQSEKHLRACPDEATEGAQGNAEAEADGGSAVTGAH